MEPEGLLPHSQGPAANPILNYINPVSLPTIPSLQNPF